MHNHKDKECCETEKKVYASPNNSKKNESHPEDDGHNHNHDLENQSAFRLFLPSVISFVLLISGIIIDNYLKFDWFSGEFRLAWYIVAYVPVGIPVIKNAVKNVISGDFFSEFFLMSIATLGAFAIKEYPEAVAVMLFYAVGEVFQTLAVQRAKSNIKALLDQRPEEVNLVSPENVITKIKAEDAKIEDIILLKPGEKAALDGILIDESGSFNTAALTGESVPREISKGEPVLAGMINLNSVVKMKVTTAFTDSKLSKILELVQDASSQKAQTELFIRKFAKIYTPFVVLLAVLITIIPYFFVEDYQFRVWLYRALIFLVISCPCALVISIPLGYFGGIGAASKNGILVKGSNFLDILSNVQNIVTDKTGTMTEGVFKVQNVVIEEGFDKDEILQIINALESKSTHPVASAIHEYVGKVNPEIQFTNTEEISGHGLKADYKGKLILVGNFKLMDKFSVSYDFNPHSIVETVIAIALDGKFAGYITIADQIKDDAAYTVQKLKYLGVKTIMLSGDKSSVVQNVAERIGIYSAFGDLLPEDKVNIVKDIKSKNQSVAFVGDGVNDAPVVALSDVGIAMGGLGSDATIETADVVIQDDKPSKIPMAINIGKKTKKIVWQNITLAFSVKAIVLILGAGGLATMWEAVFADVGVALLAIFNAIRIQKMKF